MTDCEKLSRFIDRAGCYFLATNEGNQPKCRPLGLHLVDNGILYFGVGDFKNVYRQLKENPQVEIVALQEPMNWCRATGTAVFDAPPELTRRVMQGMGMRRYYEANGYTMMLFRLENATVEYRSNMSVTDRGSW